MISNLYQLSCQKSELSSLAQFEQASIRHELVLLRVLIKRMLHMVENNEKHNEQSLSINEQSKIFQLILRAVSIIVTIQRALSTQSAEEDEMLHLLESLQENSNE